MKGMKGGGRGGGWAPQGYSLGYGYESSGRWEPMGGTTGVADWRYGQSSSKVQQSWESPAERFPKVAQRLEELRSSLDEDAMKAYRALQLALQRHSTPHGSRPNFERDFHDSLAALFPDALDISARQIGSYNQWEVKVDGGPVMFCSVRLEVLSDDPTFIRDVKSKARIVKNTLLEDGAKWMKSLQPDLGGFSFEKLTQFEKECAYRSESSEFAGLCGGGGPMGQGGFDQEGNNKWVDPASTCELCQKSLEEDQLNGVHMCVVFATFCCPDCRYSWTSHHGRLRPTGEVMGQQCMRCKGAGEMKDWRVNAGLDNNNNNNFMDTYSMGSRRSRASAGMHQSALCDACREFGNCMGIFFDPFVITTALSLVSGNFVQWKSFSSSTPELLIADLGAGMKDIQVCLQPHVYVAKNNQNNRDPSPGSRLEQNLRQQPLDEERHQANGRQGLAGGGVKNQDLFNNFIAKADPDPPQSGRDDVPPPPPPRLAGSAAELFAAQERPSAQHRAASPAPPSESSVTSSVRASKASKSNKIGSLVSAGAAAGAASASSNKISAGVAADGSAQADVTGAARGGGTLLDELLPIRRAQFLQLVLRHLKATGGNEADRFQVAEDFLMRNDGNYEKSFQYVRSLIENQAKLPF